MGWQVAAMAVGIAALVWMLSAVGLDGILRSVAAGGPALPAAVAVHAVQLWLAGLAWSEAIGHDWAAAAGLRKRDVARVRWIREGINTLLPLAQIGGQVIGVQLLVRAGLRPVRAVVGTILDVVFEAGSQVVLVLAAAGLLLAIRDGERDWLVWAGAGVAVLCLALAAIVVALRLGALRAIEAGLRRAAARWPALGDGWSMDGLDAALRERQAEWRAMLAGFAYSAGSWALGAFEVWVILRALGTWPGLAACFVIESLAMAARSAAFAIPGAVGVQEGGFVLACGLFGIGAETALALSVLKRLRELIVGAGALAAWLGARR